MTPSGGPRAQLACCSARGLARFPVGTTLPALAGGFYPPPPSSTPSLAHQSVADALLFQEGRDGGGGGRQEGRLGDGAQQLALPHLREGRRSGAPCGDWAEQPAGVGDREAERRKRRPAIPAADGTWRFARTPSATPLQPFATSSSIDMTLSSHEMPLDRIQARKADSGCRCSCCGAARVRPRVPMAPFFQRSVRHGIPIRAGTCKQMERRPVRRHPADLECYAPR